MSSITSQGYEYLLVVALALLMVPLLYALWRGPTTSDRALVLQVFGTLTVLIFGALAVTTERGLYLDVALLLAFFNFLGVVAIARYQERGLLR